MLLAAHARRQIALKFSAVPRCASISTKQLYASGSNSVNDINSNCDNELSTTQRNDNTRAPSTPSTRGLVVNELEHDILLQKFLGFHLQFPASLVERLLRQRKIWVTRGGANAMDEQQSSSEASQKRHSPTKLKRVTPKTNLLAGDTVHVRHEFDADGATAVDARRAIKSADIDRFLYFPPTTPTERAQLERTIIYRDADLLVINKPADLAVQPGTRSKNHLMRFFKALQFECGEPPRLVHRLDKKTTGVLVLARNRRTAARLAEMFRRASDPMGEGDNAVEKVASVDAFGQVVEREEQMANKETGSTCSPPQSWSVEKTYWAITTGTPADDKGTIDRHLYIPPESGIDISSDDGSTDATARPTADTLPSPLRVTIQHPNRISPYHHRFVKRALTNYTVLARVGKRAAWIRLQPTTGRKHQLRVHCADALRAPILGDGKYGVRSFRALHEAGWGSVFDFGKWTGVKARVGEEDGGMPMFLHLRQLVIKDYFKSDGGSADLVAGTIESNKNRQGDDLVLTAGLPEPWRMVAKALNLDTSIKV